MKRNWKSYAPVLVAASLLVSAAGPPTNASAATVPAELTDAEKEEFLRTAKVVKRRKVPVGVTHPERATLSDGRLTHDAHIQTVDIFKAKYQTTSGMEINFRDSYKYNIAAYKLDRLLGLNMVPVSVERKVAGDSAAVTWWFDDIMMMDKERYTKKIQVPPAKRVSWNDQMYQVRIFNELIYNSDPNLGNVLITDDWNIRIVDFSRGFRTRKDLRSPANLVRCDRRIYNALRELDEETLKRELGPYLRKSEIKGLLARRDKIVKSFDQKIAKRGEATVICDKSGH